MQSRFSKKPHNGPRIKAYLKPAITQSTWRASYKRPSVAQLRPNRNLSRITIAQRTFFTDGLPAFLVPPVVFTCLLVGLWTYKCLMTILFQDKIIYMPYMPPGLARGAKMEDYVAICKPVEWEHKHINSMDGTKIALCIGRMGPERTERTVTQTTKRHVVICYFQGNGSSTPPRLPLLSNVIRAIHSQDVTDSVEYTMVALSYRGYWTSSGRASQTGIELDAQAMLKWVTAEYGDKGAGTQIILWGQSIGAGVASTAAATYVTKVERHRQTPISGLLLETPFTGIKSMLLALYPQKWLPYRYLWPFLWNHWDSEVALRRLAASQNSPKILLLPATRDEVVPPSEVDKLERICHDVGFDTHRRDIIGALHTEATTRREGQEAVAKFVVEISNHRDHY